MTAGPAKKKPTDAARRTQQNPTMSVQRRRVLICSARRLTMANSRAPGWISWEGSSRCSNIVPIPARRAAEVPAESGEPPRSLGLHRADRAPEGNGDIGLREIGQITKDDDLALGDAGACAARRRGRPAPRVVRPLCRRGPPGSAAGVGGGGNDRWPDWRPPGRPNPRGVHAAGTSAGQPGPAPLVPHPRRRTGLPKYGRRRDRRGDRGRRMPARRTEERSSSSPRPPSSLHRSSCLRTSSRGQPGARCTTSSITVHDRGPQKVANGFT